MNKIQWQRHIIWQSRCDFLHTCPVSVTIQGLELEENAICYSSAFISMALAWLVRKIVWICLTLTHLLMDDIRTIGWWHHKNTDRPKSIHLPVSVLDEKSKWDLAYIYSVYYIKNSLQLNENTWQSLKHKLAIIWCQENKETLRLTFYLIMGFKCNPEWIPNVSFDTLSLHFNKVGLLKN